MSLASSSFTGQTVAFRPAVHRQQRRSVVLIVAKESLIGKQPVGIPDKVQVTLDGNFIKVKVRAGRIIIVATQYMRAFCTAGAARACTARRRGM